MKLPETRQAALQMFKPELGDLAFTMTALQPTRFEIPGKSNYFTIICVMEGKGNLHANLSNYYFQAPALLFSNPYQTIHIEQNAALEGTVLQFHANFFCIETHHEAVGCNGVLFNNIYGSPVVEVPTSHRAEFEKLLLEMQTEFDAGKVAHQEALASQLKLLLIRSTRLKLQQQEMICSLSTKRQPDVLQRLTHFIEEHYLTMHRPAEYAKRLGISPNALGKLTKSQFDKTITELIRERRLMHSKWQLLHTGRTIKEIAWEIGFSDEFYFSRIFKQATGVSPTAFRDFETKIRAGNNLSM